MQLIAELEKLQVEDQLIQQVKNKIKVNKIVEICNKFEFISGESYKNNMGNMLLIVNYYYPEITLVEYDKDIVFKEGIQSSNDITITSEMSPKLFKNFFTKGSVEKQMCVIDYEKLLNSVKSVDSNLYNKDVVVAGVNEMIFKLILYFTISGKLIYFHNEHKNNWVEIFGILRNKFPFFDEFEATNQHGYTIKSSKYPIGNFYSHKIMLNSFYLDVDSDNKITMRYIRD
jgi:hypothetical protein